VQGILAQRVAAAEGYLAQFDVMLLGAGEVLQDGAEGAVLDDAQVHLDGVLNYDAGLGGAAGQDLLDHGHFGECSHDLLRAAGRGQDVDVAHCLPPPPEAPGNGDMLQALHLSQMGEDLHHHRLGGAVEYS